jgi:transcriptional antiterminator RfaH
MSSLFWACAQTHPHQEQLALVNLRRQQFNSFFPILLIENKNKHIVAKAAFPGYVFVELDEDRYNWAPINFTLGVQRLLTYSTKDDGYNQPCRAHFIDALHRMRIVQRPGDHKLSPDIIPCGSMIKIRRGPFANYEALVTLSTHERLSVMFRLFNRDVNMHLSVNDVQRISAPLYKPQ